MPDVHAKFSPSASDRLIHCPPSLILGEEYGPEDTSSDYTREGTEAHSLGEFLLKSALSLPTEDPRPAMHYYSDEMQQCAEGYRDAVLEIYEALRQTCSDALISIEQQVRFEEYVPGGFGTSDAIVLGDGHMFVIDYKHGVGVKVSAEDNSQLKCYALGAYLAFAPLYEINEITLVIYQPRISNYSRWSLTVDDLLTWAKDVLKPAAALALKGAGEYACGSWCRFCKAKAICRKLAEENLALARYDFARPDVLEDDEINIILGKVDRLIEWAKSIKDYALKRAQDGYAWDDWKVVESDTKRRFKDEEAMAHIVEEAGFDPYVKKLLGITALQKMLGKARFAELLSDQIIKPQGEPTLVSRTDARPELTTAINEFMEEKNNA